MYSERTLSEIRERMNIVELVGEYVQLKKSGQGFVGLCPFHNEKSPSFHVHAIKQIFHCFGCQKGGNVFTFLSAVEGLPFPECVQRLAKRTGVELEKEFAPKKTFSPAAEPENARLVAANQWAARYFHYLLTEVKEYRYAHEYLKGRGIREATIKKFGLGVSPKGWNTLLTLMTKRGFTLAELVRAGLVIEKENSPTQGYDRFRQRLMFPILDKEGLPVGFGARLLIEEENQTQPKYLNSPESAVFSKRRTLYGLYENQRGIRLKGELVIVEGYMDVVGLYEGGVRNAVATMGTALTEEHCVSMKALCRRVITVFDPDLAGSEAWRRSVHVFLEAGIFAKDLSLPDAKDPDEYVLSESAESFFALCERAPRQVTKLLKEIAAKGPLSEQQTSDLLSELTPLLIASRRTPDRALLWDDLSLLLRVSVQSLKNISEGGFGPPGVARAGSSENRVAPSRIPKIAPSPKPVKKPHSLEFGFLKACLRWPDSFLALPKSVWDGAVQDLRLQRWLVSLGTSENTGQFKERLAALLHTETDPLLLATGSAGIFEDPANAPQSSPAEFAAVVERMKQRKKELEIRAISTQVKLTQRLGDDREQMRLLEKLKELRCS